MTPLRLVFVALIACAGLGMSRKKQEVQVRFFAEAKKADTERFATPIQLRNPARETYIERVPTISERQIKAIFPFQADDGTMGCSFRLDNSGRIALYVLSTERRGSSVVAFVSTAGGTHQVIDMIVDRTVDDGIVTIQRGLTDLEITALQKQWPVMGEQRKK